MNQDTFKAYSDVVGKEEAKRLAKIMLVMSLLEIIFCFVGALLLAVIIAKSSAGLITIIGFVAVGMLYMFFKKSRLEQIKMIQRAILSNIEKELNL